MKKSHQISLLIVSSLSISGCDVPPDPPAHRVCLNSETNIAVESHLCEPPQTESSNPISAPTSNPSGTTGMFHNPTHPYYWNYPAPTQTAPSQFRRNAQSGSSRTTYTAPHESSQSQSTTRGGFGSTGTRMSSGGYS